MVFNIYHSSLSTLIMVDYGVVVNTVYAVEFDLEFDIKMWHLIPEMSILSFNFSNTI